MFPRMAKRSVMFISLWLSITGCASQPNLPASDYDLVAEAFSTAYLCGVSGKMSPESALWAKRMLHGTLLSKYQYTQSYLDFSIGLIVNSNPPTPSTEVCNQMAMRAVEYKQNVETSNALVLAQQAALANQPKSVSTYCNKIGFQIFCQSY